MSDKPLITDEQRQRNKEIRNEIGTYFQMECKNNAWLVHVDVEGVASRYGVQVKNHILSRQDGIDVFNQISMEQGTASMAHPEGYMPLKNNVYEYLHQCYRNEYENTMDGVMDGLLDGTGCGLQAVLDRLDSTIRKDSHDFVPKDKAYGDLRYTSMNGERKQAIDKYVNKRVMQTLTYEKRKGYDDSTVARFKDQLRQCEQVVQEALSDTKQEELQL